MTIILPLVLLLLHRRHHHHFVLLLLSLPLALAGTELNIDFVMEDNTPAHTLLGNIPKQTSGFPGKFLERRPTSETKEFPFLVSLLPRDTDVNLAELVSVTSHGDVYSLRPVDRDDREAICGPLKCCDSLMCRLQFVTRFTSTTDGETVDVTVTFFIQDANDHAPKFPLTHWTILIPEHFTDYRVSSKNKWNNSLPTAIDTDSSANGIKKYTLVGPSVDNQIFRLNDTDHNNLRLELNPHHVLDYEDRTARKYQLNLTVEDGGLPPLSDTLFITVQVTNLDDNYPVFDPITKTVMLEENQAPKAAIFQFHAVDADNERRAPVKYKMATMDDRLEVDEFTGALFVHHGLDYELDGDGSGILELVVLASNGVEPDALSSSATLTIQLVDVNDNAPEVRVLTQDGQARVAENQPVGTLVANLTIIDADSVSRGKISCSVPDRSGDPSVPFTFTQLTSDETTSYEVRSTEVLDRETQASYALSFSCEDEAEPREIHLLNVSIIVADQNDNAPEFPSKSANIKLSVPEDSSLHESIYEFHAVDPDAEENGQVTYTLVGAEETPFHVNASTGVLVLNETLDFEQRRSYSFKLVASDGAMKPEQQLSSSMEVEVDVIDVNDHEPRLLAGAKELHLSENAAKGLILATYKFADGDASAEFRDLQSSLSVVEPEHAQDHFTLDPISGDLLLTEPLDRERVPAANLQIVTTDNGAGKPFTVTTFVSVAVDDVNDNAPQLTFPENMTVIEYQPILGNPFEEQVITKLRVSDPDNGPNGEVTMALDPSSNGTSLFRLKKDMSVLLFSEEAIRNYTIASANATHSPQGTYEVAINCHDNGAELRLESRFLFYVKIHEPRSLEYLQRQWLADEGSEVGQLGRVNHSVRQPDAPGRSEFWPLENNGLMTNIIVLCLAVILSVAFLSIGVALALWIRERRATNRRIISAKVPRDDDAWPVSSATINYNADRAGYTSIPRELEDIPQSGRMSIISEVMMPVGVVEQSTCFPETTNATSQTSAASPTNYFQLATSAAYLLPGPEPLIMLSRTSPETAVWTQPETGDTSESQPTTLTLVLSSNYEQTS